MLAYDANRALPWTLIYCPTMLFFFFVYVFVFFRREPNDPLGLGTKWCWVTSSQSTLLLVPRCFFSPVVFVVHKKALGNASHCILVCCYSSRSFIPVLRSVGCLDLRHNNKATTQPECDACLFITASLLALP